MRECNISCILASSLNAFARREKRERACILRDVEEGEKYEREKEEEEEKKEKD